MSNTFIYEQGWLVEKPEMEKVDQANFYEYDPIDPNNPDKIGFDIHGFNKYCHDYEDHIATLRRFKYDYPDPKKEMELGKDFEVKTEWRLTGEIDNGAIVKREVTVGIPIPITQRTYSEQEVEALKKQYYDSGLMAERIIWKDKVEKLCKEAYTDARTLYHNVMVQDWWPEFKLHNNL